MSERVRCTARTLGGDPCTHYATAGTQRCRLHSGRELRRAERKLRRLTVPAVDRLERLLAAEKDDVALKAAALILDRTAGPVPRVNSFTETPGTPAVHIGFALGGLVQQAIAPVALPAAVPVEEPDPQLETTPVDEDLP